MRAEYVDIILLNEPFNRQFHERTGTEDAGIIDQSKKASSPLLI